MPALMVAYSLGRFGGGLTWSRRRRLLLYQHITYTHATYLLKLLSLSIADFEF